MDGTVLTDFVDDFAIRWQGRVQAPIAGLYSFTLTSDDGSMLYIDQELVIDNGGQHPFLPVSGTIELSEGFHDIEVQYFEATGIAGLNLSWVLPGESYEATVPPNRLFHAVATEYCDDSNLPRILNFAVLFETENGETVKVNLN